MKDYSLYEGGNQTRMQQSFGICLGRIISVDVPNRLCKVATFGGPDDLNDQVIEQCQWLVPDANPDGDEMGVIPRRKSIGIVSFIDGEAFIGPFLRPLGENAKTTREGTEDPNLVEGDRVLATLGGNRISIKRSGLLEMKSKDSLQRLMIPDESKIVDLCRDYSLQSDGGLIRWNVDRITKRTVHRFEGWRDLVRSFMILEEKGGVSTDVISKITVGPVIPLAKNITTPVYVQIIKSSGEVVTEVHPPLPEGSPSSFKQTIKPTGEMELLTGGLQNTSVAYGAKGEINISVNKGVLEHQMTEDGDFKVKTPFGNLLLDKKGALSYSGNPSIGGSLDISDKGDISFKNPTSMLSMDSKGAIEIKSKATTIAISPAGDITINTPGKCSVESKLGFDLKALGGPVNIEGLGPMSIKSTGPSPIQISGMGQSASDFVLTNPTTLSPFTGAPLVPFSTSVQVSK